MDHNAEYDAVNNIQFFEFIGTPKNIDDVQFIIDKNREQYSKRNHKVWVVADVSNLSSTKPKLIAEFARRNREIVQKHVIDECAYCSKSLQRIMTKIYTKITGKGNPVFRNREEAVEWVCEQQNTKGITQPFV